LEKRKSSPGMVLLVIAFIFVSGFDTSIGGKDFKRLNDLYNIFSFAHMQRPRIVGVGAPSTSAGVARCPPTSSRWALETLMTLARCGLGRRPSGGRIGGCGAIGRDRATAVTTGVC
jgi:hypothetical protein